MNIIKMALGYIGTNCYLAWPENSKEAIIVDPAEFSPTIVKKIEENELSLKYIILTHGHYDHIGGVDELMRVFPDAKLVASKEESTALADPNINHTLQYLGRSVSLIPNIEVSDGDNLPLGDDTLKIISTPGHTKGGISIYVDGVLFSGDTLFRSSIGRTDLPGGDYMEILSSIRDKLYVLPDETKVLPGHMEASTIAFEKANNPFAKG